MWLNLLSDYPRSSGCNLVQGGAPHPPTLGLLATVSYDLFPLSSCVVTTWAAARRCSSHTDWDELVDPQELFLDCWISGTVMNLFLLRAGLHLMLTKTEQTSFLLIISHVPQLKALFYQMALTLQRKVDS